MFDFRQFLFRSPERDGETDRRRLALLREAVISRSRVRSTNPRGCAGGLKRRASRRRFSLPRWMTAAPKRHAGPSSQVSSGGWSAPSAGWRDCGFSSRSFARSKAWSSPHSSRWRAWERPLDRISASSRTRRSGTSRGIIGSGKEAPDSTSIGVGDWGGRNRGPRLCSSISSVLSRRRFGHDPQRRLSALSTTR